MQWQNISISWLCNISGPMVRHNCHRITIFTHPSLVVSSFLNEKSSQERSFCSRPKKSHHILWTKDRKRANNKRRMCDCYTTNPTERSTAAIERSTNESDLEWPVESHRALAEHLPSARQTCSAIARRALGGILQIVLNHFRLSSARWLLSSARWD